jgi:hypothetical protein
MVLSLRFQTIEGFIERWTVFSDKGISTIKLEETLSIQYAIRDIDDNGYKDIVIYEKIFEEGTGYETFITWLGWKSGAFEEIKTVNIVRNLKEFLITVKNYLLNEEWEALIDYAGYEDHVERMRNAGLTANQICSYLFPLDRTESVESNPFLTEEKEVVEVVYPDIMENPFGIPDDEEPVFPLEMRLVTENKSYLVKTKLALSNNPFYGKQFYFFVIQE